MKQDLFDLTTEEEDILERTPPDEIERIIRNPRFQIDIKGFGAMMLSRDNGQSLAATEAEVKKFARQKIARILLEKAKK